MFSGPFRVSHSFRPGSHLLLVLQCFPPISLSFLSPVLSPASISYVSDQIYS